MALEPIERRSAFPAWLVLLAFLPLYLTWTFDHSLWNPDETRDAGIAAEMSRNGQYAVPTLNGETFLEKPPLYYWAAAAVYKVAGRVTAGTTRLPAALFGLLGVFFTFLIGRRLFNDRTALFAAAMLATASQYFRMSHFATMDSTLAACVAGAIYFYVSGSRIGFLLFSIVAFYAKGFLGILMPGLVVMTDLITEKKFKELARIIGLGAVLFAMLVAPWFLALWKAGGSHYLKVFLIDNHWNRFAVNTGDHTQHFWFFYFTSFPGDFLPWTLLFVGFLAHIIRSPQAYLESRGRKTALVWLCAQLAFLCVSSSKRSIYLLPAFPAACLLTASWLDDALSKPFSSWDQKACFYGTVGLSIAAALFVIGGGVATKANLWIFVPAALVLVAGGVVLVQFLHQRRTEKVAFAMFGLVAVSLMVASVSFIAKLDRSKTFVPVAEVVRAKMPDRAVVGYDLSEMERGVFGFYLKQTFLNVKTPADLDALLSKTPSPKIVLLSNRNKAGELAPVIGSRMTLTYEYRPNTNIRSYLVYENP